MIISFNDRETERLFHRHQSSRLPADIQRAALRKLRMLNRAQTVQDLKVPPGNHLERLSGDRAGQFSIRINDQWRICFRWHGPDVSEVEIVDYHRG